MTARRVTREPTAAEQRELDAARLSIQNLANNLLATRRVDDAVCVMREAAEVEHRAYRQYEGHWDGWTAAAATARATFKGGRAVEQNDALLIDKDGPRESGDVSAYSVRMGCDVLLAANKTSPCV